MRLWVMRHGAAELRAERDADRRLSAAGREEVRAMAGRFAEMLPQRLLCSPYLRTRQTVQVLQEALPGLPPAQQVDWLTPDTDPDAVLLQLCALEAQDTLLVSHQPLSGLLISLLIEGNRRGRYPMPTAALASLDCELPASGAARLLGLDWPE
ncbi:MAG: histidine phosphatase family protein [Halopseudomonas yangmingensis]